MLTITQLTQFLQNNQVDFEIINHSEAILSVKDAEKYFDPEKAAPVFILQTEQGLIALIVSAKRGKINFRVLGKQLGYSTFKLADRNEILRQSGYEAGAIPLIGHKFPTQMDQLLFEADYIYGGTGDLYHTLKIAPGDVKRLNRATVILDDLPTL